MKTCGPLFSDWQGLQRKSSDKIAATLFLRDEELESVPNWVRANGHTHQRAATLEWFRQELLALMKQAFDQANGPCLKFNINFHILSLSAQREHALKFRANQNVISLDPYLPGDYQLAVSRRFPMACGKAKPKVVARHGHPSLSQQMEAIPAGKYVLLDDDIATGHTMQQVLQYLPKNIEVTELAAMIKLREHVHEQRFPLDLVDFRDFIAGSHEGGLVVQLPNGDDVRAPYLLPYVSPADRASTPLSANLDFSRKVWELNREFFRRLHSPSETLQSADPAFRQLMHYVGFKDSDSLESICAWHSQRLDMEISH